jgi:cytochrome c553
MKRTTLIQSLAVVAVAATTFCAGYVVAQNAPKPPSNDWLMDAPNDAERFKLLQRYLRGFDQPMWEVGYRWESVHDALSRDNFEAAVYHWEKIRTTIQNGYLKRPARRANAEAIFINSGVYDQVKQSFETKDSAKAWAAFTTARTACMSCHEAEKMGHMNNQRIIQTLLAP